MNPVLFKENGWRFLLNILATEKAIILCDSNTNQCIERLHLACPKTQGLPVIEMPAGEKNKTLKTCEMVWYELTEHGADRNTVLLNLGGGVVTDLGGFVASTFMRGIRFVNIPTSLLGMVDAAIGGKTGVDFGGLKNMIGRFSQPEAVVIDSSFLKTLPSRQYKNGLAEVLKHAFISGNSILNLLETNEDELISRSVQVKMEVVERDEFEAGARKKLNFGHTIGHAIESHFLAAEVNSMFNSQSERIDKTSRLPTDSDGGDSPFKRGCRGTRRGISQNKNEDLFQGNSLLHGEAIAAGMILESWLSQRITGLSDADLSSVCTVIDSVFSRIPISETDRTAIKKLLIYDKKNRDGQVQFVLLEAIGDAVIDQSVSEELLDQAFCFYAAPL